MFAKRLETSQFQIIEVASFKIPTAWGFNENFAQNSVFF